MSQPIKNTLASAVRPIVQEVFGIPQLTSLIFEGIQERNFHLTNKASKRGSQIFTRSLFKYLKEASTKMDFQKRHPTLSSFIRSNQISNHQELLTHLQKEAQVLGLTKTREYQALKTSIASKDFLLLDALIEQTNFNSANRGNRLRNLLGAITLPKVINYQIWNEIIQAIDTKKITFLDLDYSGLTRIPYGVFQLQALKCLNLYSNLLAVLPQEIGKIKSLQNLRLSYNQLGVLPPQIGKLKNLQGLTLSHNQLAALPLEIGQLHALQNIDLSHNRLSALPLGIGQLHALQNIDLSHNRLSALPQEIRKLKTLQNPSLSYNQLTTQLPEIPRL